MAERDSVRRGRAVDGGAERDARGVVVAEVRCRERRVALLVRAGV